MLRMKFKYIHTFCITFSGEIDRIPIYTISVEPLAHGKHTSSSRLLVFNLQMLFEWIRKSSYPQVVHSLPDHADGQRAA